MLIVFMRFFLLIDPLVLFIVPVGYNFVGVFIMDKLVKHLFQHSWENCIEAWLNSFKTEVPII